MKKTQILYWNTISSSCIFKWQNHARPDCLCMRLSFSVSSHNLEQELNQGFNWTHLVKVHIPHDPSGVHKMIFVDVVVLFRLRSSSTDVSSFIRPIIRVFGCDLNANELPSPALLLMVGFLHSNKEVLSLRDYSDLLIVIRAAVDFSSACQGMSDIFMPQFTQTEVEDLLPVSAASAS